MLDFNRLFGALHNWASLNDLLRNGSVTRDDLVHLSITEQMHFNRPSFIKRIRSRINQIDCAAVRQRNAA